MKPLLIWGAAGHARVIADIVDLGDDYQVSAFLDDTLPRTEDTFFERPLLHSRDDLARVYAQGVRHIIIAIGNCDVRLHLSEIAQNVGFVLASAVHPQAIVARDAHIGAGSALMAGAIVNPHCVLGESVIINTGARIDHDCIIENGAHIAPGATVAGEVTIERAAWIGVGATISDHRRIGSRALIGAGAVVVRDIPAHAIAYGVPARVYGSRNQQ